MTKINDKRARLAEIQAAAIELMKGAADDQAAIMKYSELESAHKLINGQIYFLTVSQAETQVKAAEAAEVKAIEDWKHAKEKARGAREFAEDQRAEKRRYFSLRRERDEEAAINKAAEFDALILAGEKADKLAALAFSNAAIAKGKAAVDAENARAALEQVKKAAAAIPFLSVKNGGM
jgi:hypothetical protein